MNIKLNRSSSSSISFLLLLATLAFSTTAKCDSVDGYMSNPTVYCGKVKNSGVISVEATAGTFPEVLGQAMVKQGLISTKAPESFRQNTRWRCMDSNIYVCPLGANLPCEEQADRSKTPTMAMMEFCKTEPAAAFIPASVTGRATIYSWFCKSGLAAIEKQVFSIDAQGYIADFWHLLETPNIEPK